MSKFKGAILGVTLLLSSTVSGVSIAEASVDVNPYFEKSTVFEKESLTQYSENLSTTLQSIDYELDTTKVQLPKTTLLKGKQLEFLDSVEVDLTANSNVQEAQQNANQAGNDFDLASVVVNTRYVDSKGKVLTKKDIEKMVKETGKVTFLDPNKLGIGEDPTLEEIQQWEKSQDNQELKNSLTEYEITKTHRNTGSRAYTYVNSYLYVYEEKSGTTKRNYLQGKFKWSNKGFGGDVSNSKSDFTANEILVLAWNRGPTSTTGYRSASLSYEDLYNTNRRTISPSRHHDEGSNAAAYKFNALPLLDGRRYVLREANIYAYTGWYTPSKFGEDGSATAQYAEGVDNVGLSGFSISTGGTVSVSFSKTTDYEFAKVWSTLPRN